MPRRLGPKPLSPPPAPAPTQYVAVRTKGLQLQRTLQPDHLLAIVRIDDADGYLEMDAKLALIRNARAQWKHALSPIADPLDRAIQKQKEALAEAKKAREGVTQLDAEVGAKFDELERHVKALMSAYKQEEQRLLREREQEKERERLRLQQEAARKSLQAAAAKSPLVKARLQQEAAQVLQQAAHVEETVETPIPVKGSASVDRKQKKVRIIDPIKFLHSVIDYTPTSGVYEMGKPPLMTVDKKGEPAPLVEVVNARLTDLFREQPGVVASWPGVEIYDDITIAGR